MEDELRNPGANPKDPGLIKALWVFFSSMKTAIVLLLLLAVGSVVGTVVPQGGPPEMYVQQYGRAKASVITGLGFHDVFHSNWYSFLLAMVSINLLVCSINRFKMAWGRAFRPKVSSRAEQIAGMQVSDRLAAGGPIEDARARAIAALKGARYRVASVMEDGDVCIHAAKGRIGIWGPYLTHLSLLVIFAGYILGNRTGFDGNAFIVEGSRVGTYYPGESGQTRSLGFEVKLVDFRIEHDGSHNPTAYKSRLQVYDKGKLEVEKTIDVNHPLSYRGITFYQSDFGIEGLILKVTRPDGSFSRVPVRIQTQAGPHGKEYIPEMAPVNVQTGGKTWAFFVHNFAPDYVGPPAVNASELPIHPAAEVFVNEHFAEDKGDWRRVGWVSSDSPAEYGGHKVEMEEVVEYTGLQVASNPALPIVYAGFAIMLLGVFAAFYVHHRVIRVRISGSDGSVVFGGASRGEESVMQRDIAHVREALS